MEKGGRYFVRIDKKLSDSEEYREIYSSHFEYLKNISAERFFLGGGFNNISGGMIIFTAKDMREAEAIAAGDPLFESGAYEYELFEWEIILSSN